jgi:hypothetical protein
MITITFGTWMLLTGAGLLIAAICGWQNDRRNAEYIKRLAEYVRCINERDERVEKTLHKMIDE